MNHAGMDLKKYCSLLALITMLISFSCTSEPSSSAAFVMSNKCVENHLIAPSTAAFCSITDATIVDLGNGRFRVSGYVDSQNAYGSMIRTHYTCELEYIGDDEWGIIDIDMY